MSPAKTLLAAHQSERGHLAPLPAAKSGGAPKKPGSERPWGQITFEHLELLRDIGSPWFAAVARFGKDFDPDQALREALGKVTVEQVAEFAFVASRPAAEGRAVLARGRSVFKVEALAWTLTQVARDVLDQIVQRGPELLMGTPKEPGAGLRGAH